MPLLITIACLMALLTLTSCGQGPTGKGSPADTGGGKPNEELTSVPRGEALYQANCLVCHGDREGKGRSGGAAPHNDQGHTWHHPDAQLKDWILNGRLYLGMPAFKGELSEADVEAVLAFIKPWWTEEQRQSQTDISRRYQEALDKQKKGQ